MTDQGCTFGNCFERLFLVLQRSKFLMARATFMARATEGSVNVQIGEKPTIN
jgi:hypothetical protein